MTTDVRTIGDNSRLHTLTKIKSWPRLLAMVMNRHRIVWSNFPGAPGYTNIYTGTSIVDSTPLKTFFQFAYNMDGTPGLAWLPNNATLTFPSSGDVIEEATGEIVDDWTGTAPSPLTSNATLANFAGGAGAQVQWLSSLIVAGRRVQGKTFLVPMLPVAMDQQGSLATATQTKIQAAAVALIIALAGELKVWSRPFVPDPLTNPPVGQPGHKTARAGANAQVISSRVPDIAVSLRTRRQ